MWPSVKMHLTRLILDSFKAMRENIKNFMQRKKEKPIERPSVDVLAVSKMLLIDCGLYSGDKSKFTQTNNNPGCMF